MRIAFLSTTSHMGGAEASLREVIGSLRRARPNWVLRLLTPLPGPLAEEAVRLGASVAVVPFPLRLARFGESQRSRRGYGSTVKQLAGFVAAVPAAARYLQQLRRALTSFAPDVIHANGIKMDLLAAWARPPGSALVWHIHDYLGSRPLSSLLLRGSRRRTDAIVTNSDSVTADVHGQLGSRVPVCRVYNAVDADRFARNGARADLDRLAGLESAPTGTTRVGLVATAAWWKGHRVFLAALGRLPHDARVRGYVIGGPVYETDDSQQSHEELRLLADELHVADRVGFTGVVADPAAAMRALDIVVHASTEPEPFGLVIAEAMTCGRPVIVSRSGGAAELVVEGATGLMFEPGNVDQLAQCIGRLAADGRLRARLAEAARAAACDRFATGRLAEQLVPLYDRVSGVRHS